MSNCKLSLYQVLSRLALKVYAGPAATALGSSNNYAYAFSDPVPDSQLWLVYRASGVALGGITNFLGLYLIPPDEVPGPPPNGGAYVNSPFFAGSSAVHSDGPPVGNAVRVDRQFDNNSDTTGVNPTGERTLLERPLIVPPGWRLLLYNGTYGNSIGGTLTTSLVLNLAVAVMKNNEEFDVP